VLCIELGEVSVLSPLPYDVFLLRCLVFTHILCCFLAVFSRVSFLLLANEKRRMLLSLFSPF
jgi:hypothetical protein